MHEAKGKIKYIMATSSIVMPIWIICNVIYGMKIVVAATQNVGLDSLILYATCSNTDLHK